MVFDLCMNMPIRTQAISMKRNFPICVCRYACSIAIQRCVAIVLYCFRSTYIYRFMAFQTKVEDIHQVSKYKSHRIYPVIHPILSLFIMFRTLKRSQSLRL